MKLVRIHGVNKVSIDDVPTPNPGPRDVMVRIAACGICGSDVHYVRHGFTLPNGEPMPLGHEAAGVVDSAGAEVEGFTPGMRVFINPTGQADNVIGNMGTEGAFGELLLIRDPKPGVHLLPIPDDLPFTKAALVEPLAVGLHGINRGQVTAQTKAVVFGCGPIGLAGILWLRRRGVAHAVAVDISDARLERARKMGAHVTINPKTENLFERLTALHGVGIPVLGEATVGTDVFFDMAGGPGVIADIIKLGQYHSRLVVTAVYPRPVEVNFLGLLLKEMDMTTAASYPTELHEVLAELPHIDPQILDDYVSHTLKFDDFLKGLGIAQDANSGKVMIEFA